MNFLLADTFSTALAKLTNEEQKQVKITVFDLQQNPSAPGLSFHRIEGSKDPNFWSMRVGRDIRLILHKAQDSLLLCYVGHHDDAYRWAVRRRLETHPKTGAAQIVEVRERVEEITLSQPLLQAADVTPARYYAPLFHRLSREDMLDIGVPEDWVDEVRDATEYNFMDYADHIPSEAAEALLDYIVSGVLRKPDDAFFGINPFAHPDAQRRFRIMDNLEELERALNYPWDKWAVFLHPAQRSLVEQDFNGPARVAGSAGTGKTVVALHRAAHILKRVPKAKLLLTTFSRPLANLLKHKLKMLYGDGESLEDRITILPFEQLAYELFTLAHGYHPRPAKPEAITAALAQALEEAGDVGFPHRFLLSEWRHVVDAWQLDSLDAYAHVPRLGRKNRLGQKQRERLWPVFERARALLASQNMLTWPQIFAQATAHFAAKDHKPFTHIIVDEAQDLGVPELRLIAAIGGDNPDALFFAGDLGQRIFQEPFSWKALGVDVRGRSRTLKVNYRTSHQIRTALDRLLPTVLRDVDGNEEDRSATISVFNGPAPEICLFEDEAAEIDAIGLWLYEALEDGVAAEDIGIFVRSEKELHRARAAVTKAEQTALQLSERVEDRTGRIAIGTMHLAKGLEFKYVAVMACDEDVLPQQDRLHLVADEGELNEVYDTERHLLYVACTRTREKLLVSGLHPGSEFLADFAN